MTRIIFILIFILLYSFAIAQKQDYIWLYGTEPYDIILPDRAADTIRGAFNMDFSLEPPRVYYDPTRFLDFEGVNSSTCNSKGEILAYTNGMVIYNQFDNPIADTINYSEDWEYSNDGDKKMSIPSGILGVQGAIILPNPADTSKYYTFYTTRDRENPPFTNYKISYASFEVDDFNKNGILIEKDIIMLKDSLSGSITAVKHGNGRDWWLIAPRRIGNILNIWLVDPNGVHYRGRLETGLSSFAGIGQIYSSPDGNWLSWYVGGYFVKNGGQLFVAKFDRCDGSISSPDFHYIDLSDFRFGFGVSFSYDSRYLYMCNQDFIYQYDLFEEDILGSKNRVATYDGFYYTFPYDTINPIKYDVDFNVLGLAPDGRIYISPGSAWTRLMSVIHFPQKQGIECDVRQHLLFTPTALARGIPNFPTYRLGALDGSSCDTLGIDNHPVAKFRYEVDSTDYLSFYFTDLSYFRPESWSWNFGDNSPIETERYPTHRYTKAGTYEVCLTVNNENSYDQICKTITIGTTNMEEVDMASEVDISFFPNPVHDYLQIRLGDYVPEYGYITIYNTSGNVVLSKRIFYGNNVINIFGLKAGFYSCIIMDKNNQIGMCKITKL